MISAFSVQFFFLFRYNGGHSHLAELYSDTSKYHFRFNFKEKQNFEALSVNYLIL